MKIIYLFILINSILNAKVYYSKIEPYELRNISANVPGLVVFIDENMLGKKLTSNPYIKIDSELDEKEIQYIDEKLLSLANIITSNQKKLKNFEELLEKKRSNYEKIKDLKIKSVVEKDREFYDLITSENLLLNTKNEISNLKVQMADLKLRKAVLLRSIKDKNLSAKGFVLYSLFVRPGQVVAMSTPLAQVADVSKAILTIFLDYEDLAVLKEKTVFIDGIETKYKVTRLSNIADTKNISKYKAQIIIDAPNNFSKLAKIELK